MPDSLERPWMLRAVIPLVSGQRLAGFGRCVVDKFVALALGHAAWISGHAAARCLPGFAPITGALDDLSEPAARLRGINAVRISRRSLHVVNLPAAEVGTADVPLFALAVRTENKSTFASTHQHSYLAHLSLLVSLGL